MGGGAGANEPAAVELAAARKAVVGGARKEALAAYRAYIDALIAATEAVDSSTVGVNFMPSTALTWDVILAAGADGELDDVVAAYNAYLDAAEAVCMAMQSAESGDVDMSTAGAPPPAVAAEMDLIDEACAAAIGAAGDMSLAIKRTHTMLSAVSDGSRAPLSARTLISLGESLKRHAENAKNAGGKGFNIFNLNRGMGMAAAVACLCCDPGADGDTKRAELAFFLRGWAEGPGFAGVREHGAIEVLDSVLDVCGATPRFAVGTRVVCNAGELVHGKVVAHWWRHPQWAAGDPAAVYQVQLESNGELIFAPADVDECIKAA